MPEIKRSEYYKGICYGRFVYSKIFQDLEWRDDNNEPGESQNLRSWIENWLMVPTGKRVKITIELMEDGHN